MEKNWKVTLMTWNSEIKLTILIICSMLKAAVAGVPRTLANPPMLWLPCRVDANSNSTDTLAEIAGRIDHLFQQVPFKFRFFRTRKCLLRSLALVWFARKMNAEVIVHFGMKNLSGTIMAHCWLSLRKNGKFETETDSGYSEIWNFQVKNQILT